MSNLLTVQLRAAIAAIEARIKADHLSYDVDELWDERERLVKLAETRQYDYEK